jgi:alkanesulfonate monooxygenase SsuD/methylene tetrahydromethanopterin reductase-like flavin-dependent oxidoreductase (luciferase family)
MIGFDSFWIMDHFHQIPTAGKPDEPMLESWTTISVLAGITNLKTWYSRIKFA